MAETQGKKLINAVGCCVDDCLEGFSALNPEVQLLKGHHVAVRADISDVISKKKVTLIAGGGSGHEPAHAGYIGCGMLSAAVAGAVFTSPPPASILAAIRTIAMDNPAGALLIVKNYTGDRLNFGLAAERARAENLKVDMVVIGEDCALTSTDKTAGRRGLAGTVFIHKIAGALSEKGHDLESIISTVQEAASQMGTIGLSLSPCSVPGSGPSFQLGHDEMELGLGIHGEAGVRRVKVCSAKDAVHIMFSHMMNPQSSTHLSVEQGDHVALMINNLGGTSVLEMNIIAKEAIMYLEVKGIHVDRAYCGSYMTSLEMAGISLTLLKLNDLRRQCLDAPTTAPAWITPLISTSCMNRETPSRLPCKAEAVREGAAAGDAILSKEGSCVLYQIIHSVCEALIQSKDKLNQLDTQSGDGDCGTTFKQGADAILAALGSKDQPKLPVSCPHQMALALADIVEQEMGGSSGALYSLLLSAAAGPLKSSCDIQAWADALSQGIGAVRRYGGAEPGDRTMLDSLHAASLTLTENLKKPAAEALQAAAKASQEAAVATAKMAACAGRASYVSAEYLTQPDPGAHAVGVWMHAASQAFKQ